MTTNTPKLHKPHPDTLPPEGAFQIYYGTKLINATPMNRNDYNCLRGWPIPSNETPTDEGYLVEYLNGGQPNVEGFIGYISWSPKDVFERAYQPVTAMSFGHALVALKSGHKVARAGWNGKGMWLQLVPGSTITVQEGRPLASVFPIGHTIEYLPHIDMKTADNKLVPWLASQTDVLADDWTIAG